MTPEQVAASQRERMLRAMAVAAAGKGYKATTVSDVVGGARVSRKTFYEHFEGLEACFLAAYEACVEQLRGGLGGALDAELEPIEQGRRLLAAYLQLLADEPEMAKTYLVEAYSAGPRASARRREALGEFAGLIRMLHERLGGEDLGVVGYELIVGAIVNAVTIRVATGETDRLPELLDELHAFVLRALEKLEEGTYGTCDRCGGPIAAARLRFSPESVLCIDCAGAVR